MLHIRRKSVFLMLFVILLTLSLCPPAFAADDSVDLSKSGSITTTPRDSTGVHNGIPGCTIQLFHVAEVSSENGNLVYRFTKDFSNCGISLDDLNAEGLAEHLEGFAVVQGLTGTMKNTDRDGNVTFRGLNVGLYLVTQYGAVAEYFPFTPFLVAIPTTNAEGTGWIYDIDASPKAQPRPEPPVFHTKLTVKKVWEGAGIRHPESVEVCLLRNGRIYDTVVLNDKNSWKYTWHTLDTGFRWSIMELNVPTGYTAHYESVGTTATITNIAGQEPPVVPETPDPRTNQVPQILNRQNHP